MLKTSRAFRRPGLFAAVTVPVIALLIIGALIFSKSVLADDGTEFPLGATIQIDTTGDSYSDSLPADDSTISDFGPSDVPEDGFPRMGGSTFHLTDFTSASLNQLVGDWSFISIPNGTDPNDSSSVRFHVSADGSFTGDGYSSFETSVSSDGKLIGVDIQQGPGLSPHHYIEWMLQPVNLGQDGQALVGYGQYVDVDAHNRVSLGNEIPIVGRFGPSVNLFWGLGASANQAKLVALTRLQAYQQNGSQNCNLQAGVYAVGSGSVYVAVIPAICFPR